MKSTLMRLNFNGGELSPFLDGRVDFPKYTSGAKEMKNFVPTVYGPMTKRPGTRFVEDLGAEAAIYPFEFSESQAYILAFVDDGDGETDIQFFTGDGRLLDDLGDEVELHSSYSIEQAKDLKFAQTGDIVYFTHSVGGIQSLSRTSENEFELDDFLDVIRGGPFQSENEDEDITVTITLSGSSYFISFDGYDLSDDDEGSLVRVGYNLATKYDEWISDSGSYSVGDYIHYDGRLYEVTSGSGSTGDYTPLHTSGTESDGNLELTYYSTGYGYLLLGGYISADNKSGGLLRAQFPPDIVNGDATDSWSWGSFGGTFGWPSAVTLHQQRLVFGGSTNEPQTVFGSVTGDISSFEEGTDDDDAFQFTLAANKKNPISWLVSNVNLGIGTLGSEFSMTSSGSAITPTDVSITQIGQYGSKADCAPLIANGFTLFSQAGGRKLRELRYDYNSERNYARDLNKTAEHIVNGGNPISQIAYQSEPYQIVWARVGEELYAFTYETEEDVSAWSRQAVGNVQSIATIPNGDTDRLWMVIERNGNYYIEYMTDFFTRDKDISDAVFVDSSLAYEGEEVSTLTGLDHLEGETVNVLNNGSVEESKIVSGGSITLSNATTSCVVGLPVKSAWQSMRLEGGSNDGVGQGKAKKLSKVIFRLEKTGAGLRYGKGTIDSEFSGNQISEIDVRSTTMNMDTPPDLLSGDTGNLPIGGGSDSQYMLRIEHEAPTPCTIIAVMLTVDTAQ